MDVVTTEYKNKDILTTKITKKRKIITFPFVSFLPFVV